MSIGIALSGGGVRGAAHIGVLRALEENGIKPQYISGASSGSIVALLYAMGYSTHEIENIFINIGKSIIDFDYFGLSMFTIGMLLKKKVRIDGLIRGDRVEMLVEKLAADKGIVNINEIKMPLAISAVDINTSETIMFTSKKMSNSDYICINNAKVSEAVRASISFPFIFKPKILGVRRLVDGGVRENVPVRILKNMGAKKVIAVNLGYCGEHKDYIDNILEITSQTIDIMAYSIFKCESKYADYVLKPRIYNVKLLEVERISECIKRGYNYTNSVISDIKKNLVVKFGVV